MSRTGPDGVRDGDCIRVDTTVLDEVVERVGRAREDAAAAGSGLDRVPVAGVAVGGQALHDALGDLARLWAARLGRTEAAAQGLAASLREARWQYAATEHAALAAAGPPGQVPLLPGTEAWLPAPPPAGTGTGLGTDLGTASDDGARPSGAGPGGPR